MSKLVLHHYDASPFSEKIRKVLAHKGVPWYGVVQPNVMPKPDLLPLTGGYRRIPVLQVGADVYCDSQLIARTLERLYPEPTLYPGASEGTAHAWSLWADRLLFLQTVAIVFAEIGALVPPAFIADRTKMMPGRDFAAVPKEAPHAREQVRGMLALLEAQLADGRTHLLGPAFSLADAACFHPLWFLRVAPQASTALGEFPGVQAWMERIDRMGHGAHEAMTPGDALAIARDAMPAPARAGADVREPNGLTPGQRVEVVPDDYGFDPVAGEIVSTSAHDIAIRRRDPALGEVVVHFPRIGFRVQRAG
ncbi:MAG: glutathione S-transferase family protein [Candidatus Binatia bacterium]